MFQQQQATYTAPSARELLTRVDRLLSKCGTLSAEGREAYALFRRLHEADGRQQVCIELID
jgi:hypothetical protein